MLYFHENQIVYPVRNEKERDFQYGYNQILSWYNFFFFMIFFCNPFNVYYYYF